MIKNKYIRKRTLGKFSFFRRIFNYTYLKECYFCKRIKKIKKSEIIQDLIKTQCKQIENKRILLKLIIAK